MLSTVQGFLEDELVPVIQSDVNHELRELQTNNALFAVPPSLNTGVASTSVATTSGGGGSGGGSGKKRTATLADTSHVVASQMSQLLCARRLQASTAAFGYTRGGGGGGGGYGSLGRPQPPLRGASSSYSYSSSSYSYSSHTSTSGGALSAAVLSCARAAVPLFDYWLQLPQHRNMVTTVLDRCTSSQHTLLTHPTTRTLYQHTLLTHPLPHPANPPF